MQKSVLVLSLLMLFPGVASADMPFDPCVAEEKKFETGVQAARGQMQMVRAKWESWYANPETLSPEVFNAYRDAIRLHLFNKWKASPAGQGTIQSWGVSADDPVALQKFLEFIYSKEIPETMEKQAVYKVFRQDYEGKVKAELDSAAAENEKAITENKQKLDEACEPTVFAQVFRATIGNLLMTVGANFDAAANESGDISKAIRAVTGVSVDSIREWGLQGGENSEIHKLNAAIDSVMEANGMGSSTVVGQIATAINPTKWKIDVPQVKIPNLGDIPVVGKPLDDLCGDWC